VDVNVIINGLSSSKYKLIVGYVINGKNINFNGLQVLLFKLIYYSLGESNLISKFG
jgi:hypothetical protein